MKSVRRKAGTLCGLAAACACTANGQVSAPEQSTTLTAYVTDQATIFLGPRASSLSLERNRESGAFSFTAHRSAEDFRILRVYWVVAPKGSLTEPRPLGFERVVLPVARTTSFSPPSLHESALVRVKIESFEF